MLYCCVTLFYWSIIYSVNSMNVKIRNKTGSNVHLIFVLSFVEIHELLYQMEILEEALSEKTTWNYKLLCSIELKLEASSNFLFHTKSSYHEYPRDVLWSVVGWKELKRIIQNSVNIIILWSWSFYCQNVWPNSYVRCNIL